jgi:AmiR/NasT family two-component response regulator
MVSVQASCSTSEAFVLMQDRANDDGVTLAAIAVEVVERRLRFGD